MSKIRRVIFYINRKIWGFAMRRVDKHVTSNNNTKFRFWCNVCDYCDGLAQKVLSY